jgi:hypothetical protein
MRNKGAAVQCTANWSTNFLSEHPLYKLFDPFVYASADGNTTKAVMTAPYGFSTLSW